MITSTLAKLLLNHPKIATAFVLFVAFTVAQDGAVAANGFEVGLDPMRHTTNTGP